MDVDNYNRYLMMDNRIRLEKQNKRSDQITELILDNCRAKQIRGLTDEFVNLKSLSAINIGLVTLEGFPRLPNVDRIDLCDNKLTGGLEFLRGCPRLKNLNISGNSITDIGALEPLKAFPDLVSLDVYNCDITNSNDYRHRIFDLLPNLQTLDGYTRSDLESSESESEASEDDRMSVENNDPISNESLIQPINVEACQVTRPVDTIHAPSSVQEQLVEDTQTRHHEEILIEQNPQTISVEEQQSEGSNGLKEVESVEEKKSDVANDASQAQAIVQDDESKAEVDIQIAESQADVTVHNDESQQDESQAEDFAQNDESQVEIPVQSDESQAKVDVQHDEVESSDEEEDSEDFDGVEIVYDEDEIISDEEGQIDDDGQAYHDEEQDDEEYTDEDDEGVEDKDEYSESEHEVEINANGESSQVNEASVESIEQQDTQSEDNKDDELEEGEVVGEDDEDDDEADEHQPIGGSQEVVSMQPVQQVGTEPENLVGSSITSDETNFAAQSSAANDSVQKGQKRMREEEAGDANDSQ